MALARVQDKQKICPSINCSNVADFHFIFFISAYVLFPWLGRKTKMAPDLNVVTTVLILMSFWNACHSFDQSQIDAFINKVELCFRFFTSSISRFIVLKSKVFAREDILSRLNKIIY